MLDPLPAVLGRHRFRGKQSTKYASNSGTRKTLKEKPLVSGKGIDVYISLVESVLFLRGFEQGHTSEQSTVVLRGFLHLHVTKPAKIKAVTLALHGKAVTKWPEGIPPKKVRFQETESIINHTWSCFDSQLVTAASGACTDHVELFERFPVVVPAQQGPLGNSINSSSKNLGPNRANRLSRSVSSLWNLPKGDSSTKETSIAQQGYRTFDPGDYIYDFEFPLDSHLPETIEVESGSVKYKLKAIVERAGAFLADLVGSRDVTLIRTPAEGSLEQFEPIAINRKWKDELHIEIIVSGKSFPLGAQIPISFRITTLATIQFHWIKVFATEHTEYLCSNKGVHRMEPARKIQLFEKWGDVPLTSTISGNLKTTVSGGVCTFDQNSVASKVQTEGPMGFLSDLSGDASISFTEMEVLAQLPSCRNMKDNDKSLRFHSDTTYQNIQVHHWIKILIRLSRSDPIGLNKRQYFEIAINAPLRVLSCEVTEATTTLPAYSASQPAAVTQMNERLCPQLAKGCYATPPCFVPNSGTFIRSPEHPIATLMNAVPANPQDPRTSDDVESNLPRFVHLFRELSFDSSAF